MRGVGLVVAALWLAACEPAALAATAVSITLSLSLSAEHAADLTARLVPERVRLRPGEEVSLQLELRSTNMSSRALALAVQVDGPSRGLVVTLRSDVTVPRGVTRVPVRLSALPSVSPGRYDIEIRVLSQSRAPPNDDGAGRRDREADQR